MTPVAARRRAHWRLAPGVFTARPKLMAGACAGLAVGLACAVLAPGLRASTCAIAGWNAFCAVYLALTLRAVAGRGPDDIRARAAREDQGQAVILALILAACTASLAAVAVELSLAQRAHGVLKAAHVAVAISTVTASWATMQVAFALHYAHEYYATDPASGADARGLAFPAGDPPDYWDFLHFAVVIGVAAQTADIAFTGKALRRFGTCHSLIAFVFNTLIVALTISLVAGLF